MNHLKRLGGGISVPVEPDEQGFTGRECPACEGYFKVEFGTGLKGENLPCHCPYCGHIASHDRFWTKEQIEYAQSIALREVTDALLKDLKKLEFEHKPRDGFGLGVSLKVRPGRRTPIHYYREERLETEIVCDNCTLRYSVYGVFAFCPDCGEHNSLQTLRMNLEVIGKMLDFACDVQGDVRERLLENALEDCVSSFDGFGRELCRLHASECPHPAKAKKVSFQNIEAARGALATLFGIDLSGGLDLDEWRAVVLGFQKRHIIAHKMGVVDDEYIQKSGDKAAVAGHKVRIEESEVRRLAQILGKLARRIADGFGGV